MMMTDVSLDELGPVDYGVVEVTSHGYLVS